MIHPTAEVEEGAQVGEGTRIWHHAHVRSGAKIGANCILGYGVYVDAGVHIGDNCKLQNRVSVYHGVTIEDGVFVGPHVAFTNDKHPRSVRADGSLSTDEDWTVSPVLVRSGASIGAGAVILPGVTLGRWCLVGAGAVVSRDVPDHGLVTGNPARLTGYACKCGHTLHSDGATWQCDNCHETYDFPTLPPLRRGEGARGGVCPMIRIAKPRIGDAERKAVLAVLESGQLTNGPVTKRLEVAFARDVSHTAEAVAVSSGTAALHLALLAHGVGPGDEVITTPFSFQATANMVLATGARPVFVDVIEDGNMDASLVEAAVTARTKALLPVNLYGRLCNMPALSVIAERHGVALIEDAAQAHGAELGGRRAGSFGTGCFSLYATKNMTAGEGGLVTTNDSALAERLRRLRSHGEIDRYESAELGYNYRITEVGAALALAQLDGLADANDTRRRNAAYLSQHLHGVSLPPGPVEPGAHVWHQYTLRVSEGRDALQAHLHERGVQAVVYYPQTLPSQALYRELGYDDAAYPVARRLAAEVLSLPVHPGLSEADLQTIVEAVNEWTASPAPGASR